MLLEKDSKILRVYFFYGAVMLIYAYRFLSNSLLGNFVGAPLQNPSIDNTFWLFHLLKIPNFFTANSVVSSIFDLLLLFLPISCILLSKRKIAAILFTVFYTIYFIVFNTYAVHHYHSLMGIVMLSIPFWFIENEERFELVWEGIRYYFLFIMLSAAFWKVSRDGVYHFDQMVNILKAQHTQYLFENPNGFFTSFYYYLIQNEVIAYILLLCGLVIELCFLIGFFTRQYDKLLLVLGICFFVINYFITGIVNIEIAILLLTLIDWNNTVKPLFTD